MNVRQRKRLLSFSTALVVACAGGVLAAGLMLPIDVGAELAPPEIAPNIANTAPDDATDATHAPKSNTARPSLQRVRQLCSRNLHKPLYDPEPEPAKTFDAKPKPEPKPDPLKATLIGTAIERGRSMALFQKTDRSIKVCAVGESFQQGDHPVTIKQIRSTSVTVEYQGKTRELEIPERLLGDRP